MILSHAHRFIFIKTTKTAGTSIEIALSKFCGPDDVITPIAAEDEALRSSLGHRGPQNHLGPESARLARTWRREGRRFFYNHMSAREVLDLVGPEVWSGYFKFCVERNPFDRVISFYYWKQWKYSRGGRRPPWSSLDEFLASDFPRRLHERGMKLYTLDGRIAVDRICRYENLAEDLEQVRRIVGLTEPLDLPRAKARQRERDTSPAEILDEARRLRIAELFAEEIERYGYAPEPVPPGESPLLLP